MSPGVCSEAFCYCCCCLFLVFCLLAICWGGGGGGLLLRIFLSFFFFCIPSFITGFTILDEVFAYVTFFFFLFHQGSHIPSSWMVHAGCVLLLAFTHVGHECLDLLSPGNGMHVCTD